MAVLPTLLTLSNAICGFLAIFFATRPQEADMPFGWNALSFGAVFIFLGMLFDGLDGRVARLTRQTSDMGEQLDSMADMVTFGVAPAVLVVQLIGVGTPFVTDALNTVSDRVALVVAVIFVACAALRLARFNVEKKARQDSDPRYFKGLPTPGAAGAIASLVMLSELDVGFGGEVNIPEGPFQWAVLAVMLAVAFAMVSRLPYIHATNRYVRGRARFSHIARIVVIVPLLAIWPTPVIALVFTAYALSAPTVRLLRLMGWLKSPPPVPPVLSPPEPQQTENADVSEGSRTSAGVADPVPRTEPPSPKR